MRPKKGNVLKRGTSLKRARSKKGHALKRGASQTRARPKKGWMSCRRSCPEVLREVLPEVQPRGPAQRSGQRSCPQVLPRTPAQGPAKDHAEVLPRGSAILAASSHRPVFTDLFQYCNTDSFGFAVSLHRLSSQTSSTWWICCTDSLL